MGHTPGPWMVCNKGEYVCAVEGHEPVAEITSVNVDYQANAALVADAPALLDALEGMLRTNYLADTAEYATAKELLRKHGRLV